jgi:hypothetical protein
MDDERYICLVLLIIVDNNLLNWGGVEDNNVKNSDGNQLPKYTKCRKNSYISE